MKKKPNFKPESYRLYIKDGSLCVEIIGLKLPPPSKRITLNQKNIKVLSAKIVYKHKKGDIEFEVIRINRMKTVGEIRLHTHNLLYPGMYILALEYKGELDESSLGERVDQLNSTI